MGLKIHKTLFRIHENFLNLAIQIFHYGTLTYFYRHQKG